MKNVYFTNDDRLFVHTADSSSYTRQKDDKNEPDILKKNLIQCGKKSFLSRFLFLSRVEICYEVRLGVSSGEATRYGNFFSLSFPSRMSKFQHSSLCTAIFLLYA